jgi:type II secretory pathway predicted ATPase ExeA
MYTEHYGLTERPFQLTPDARYYFESRTHKKAKAYLGYGLAQGEGFIVITGDVGAGKSTLVAHLMATIDRSRLNAINIVSTQVEGTDMLRLVAQGLGLPTSGMEKAQLLERVERHLEDQARSGKRTLLVVDEAQNLPVSTLEELRMLSNYQVAGRALLQIFLLGQPEFRDQLAHSEALEQLRQRRDRDPPSRADGCQRGRTLYRHRLGLVGWTGRPGFDSSAFAEIYRHTRAFPAGVNQLAPAAAPVRGRREADTIDAAVVNDVVNDMAGEAQSSSTQERVLPLRGGDRSGSAAATPSRFVTWRWSARRLAGGAAGGTGAGRFAAC